MLIGVRIVLDDTYSYMFQSSDLNSKELGRLFALKTKPSGNCMEMHLIFRRNIKHRYLGETADNINRHVLIGQSATPDPLSEDQFCDSMCKHKRQDPFSYYFYFLNRNAYELT